MVKERLIQYRMETVFRHMKLQTDVNHLISHLHIRFFHIILFTSLTIYAVNFKSLALTKYELL